MAQGDLTVFEEATLALLDGTHDLDTDTIKCALVSSLPSASASGPGFAGTAGTDLSANEVSGGTSYTAGGVTLTISLTESGGTVTFDATNNPSWTQDGSGPTDIVAAVVYNDSTTDKDAIAFVDMTTDAGTTPLSLQAGDITLNWNASGIFTLS